MICDKCGAKIQQGTVCPNCFFDNAGVDFTPKGSKEPRKTRVGRAFRNIALFIIMTIATLPMAYNILAPMCCVYQLDRILWRVLLVALSVALLYVTTHLIFNRKHVKKWHPLLIPVIIGAMLLTNLVFLHKSSEEYGKLQGLSYNYGAWCVYGDFSLVKIPDKDSYWFTASRMNGEYMTVSKEVDASVMEDLQEIMEEEGYFSQDLFSYSFFPSGVTEGGWGEHFAATFDNGKISYNKYGFGKTKNYAISNYLLELADLPPEEEPAG